MKGSVAIRERNLSSWVSRLADALLIVLAHLLATLFRDGATLIDVRRFVATLLGVVVFRIVADANGLYSPTLRSAPRRVEIGKTC